MSRSLLHRCLMHAGPRAHAAVPVSAPVAPQPTATMLCRARLSCSAPCRNRKLAMPPGSELAGSSNLTPKVHEKLQQLQAKYALLSERMSGNISDLSRDELAKLSKEYSDTGLIVTPYVRLLEHYSELTELQQMIESKDQSLQSMAKEERAATLESIGECEREIIGVLLPKDSAEQASAIMEIRAGTGGDEASLFARDILNMYTRYVQRRGWKLDIISSNHDGDQIKDAVVEISGRRVFGSLMFESGVHRVQRVPATDTQGRIHTSTVTVAVLPQPTDVHIEIKDSDLRIDVFRASGKGGQHVNTTDSAVRITHLPTGIAVENQQERSQIQNKAKAMQILRARLYDRERQKLDAERMESRKRLIGSGDRSEKCRTYNYPQSRVTDHRINFTSHDLEGVMAGEALQLFIDQLRIQHDLDELASMG